MRVFFSHPISTYCSAQEDAALACLSVQGFEVVNPSDPSVQASCGPDMTKWAALASAADAVAFLPLPDGRIGAGVIMEVEAALSAGKPVMAFSSDGASLSPVANWPQGFDLVSLDETRQIMRAFKQERVDAGLRPIPTRAPACITLPRCRR